MARFVLCFLITLELALVVWGATLHPARIPELPPPPIYDPVVNNSLIVIIGGSATVRPDQEVLIDCEPLIETVRNQTGLNPRVTWEKNNIVLSNRSENNVIISQDERFLIIAVTSLRRGGELGTSGNYTCTVCAGDANIDCLNDTSPQIVCGEPHLVPPVNETVQVAPSAILITLICGQDVYVPTLDNITTVIINCDVFNGSEPFTTTIYKDGSEVVGNSIPHLITNPEFATYTVVVLTEKCGATRASSRILQEGALPSINTTMIEKPTTVSENKRINVGNPVNISSGANLTIDCIVTGTPPIMITWLRLSANEIIVQNTSTITIAVTNTTDGDDITCRADNNIGFDMATTTINVDVCDLICKNGTRSEEDCSCDCYDGYTGRECETNINDCDPNPCQNGGRCKDLINDYFCNCTEDFDGKQCTNYIGKCPYNYMTVSVGFSQSSYSVNEGVRDGVVKLTVVLDRPVGCNCYTSFSVITGEITATSDDYNNASKTIRIPDGLTYDEFEIEITDDDDYEDSETFFVTIDPLSLPYGVTLGSNAYAEVTILDNDRADVKFKEVNCNVSEAVGSVEHTLVLNKPLSADVTIEVITVNQSTHRGCDYDAGPYSVTIPAGEIESSFNAIIYDDDVYESDETFQLVIDRRRLPSRITHVFPYRSTVTILNDEEQIKVNFNESSYEVDEHKGPAQPVLVLSKPSPCCLHVLVKTMNETMNDTATEGEDYGPVKMAINVTFPVGVTCAPFDIPIIDDTLSEGNETFDIVILEDSLPFGVVFDDADKSTTVTIIENDFYLHFEKPEYTFGEEDGSLKVVLVLDKKADTDVTIQVMDVNNTATGGEDYVTGPYNVTINEGEMNASLIIGILDDNVYENGDGKNGEDFRLAIVNDSLPHGIHLGDIHETKVTILDDEYTFCFELPSYLIEERGVAELVLNLSRPLRENILVNFSYFDLTATGNYTLSNNEIDYYASHVSPYEALIPAGTQEFRLNIEIVDDRRLEDYELFRIITGPPDLPRDAMPCTTDVIIRDDDDFVVTFDKANYTVKKNEDVTVGLLLIYPEDYVESVMFPINVTVDEISVTATGGLTDGAEGADFVFQNYSYSFDDKEEKKTLIIRTIDDNIVEPDETYTLNITTVTAGDSAKLQGRIIYGENATFNITIQNDDVTYLRIDKNIFRLDRPVSEDIHLNVTYNNGTNEDITIFAGDTIATLQTDVTRIEVLIPDAFEDNKIESFKIPKDSKIQISITFVK